MRECYIHLEEKGILKTKFKNKFRKNKPWVIDRTKRDEDGFREAKKGEDDELF